VPTSGPPPLDPPAWTDEEGFRLALQRRDPLAWDAAVTRYDGSLRRAASSLLWGPADPENALGQTWFQALRYAHTYDPTLPPYGWLASICARVCLTQRGRLAAAWARVRQLAQREPPRATPPAPPEVRTVIHAALAQLPDADRQVLTLRYLFGLSIAEVARVLDVEPAALRQRVLRALRRLEEGPAAATLAAFVDDDRRHIHAAR